MFHHKTADFNICSTTSYNYNLPSKDLPMKLSVNSTGRNRGTWTAKAGRVFSLMLRSRMSSASSTQSAYAHKTIHMLTQKTKAAQVITQPHWADWSFWSTKTLNSTVSLTFSLTYHQKLHKILARDTLISRLLKIPCILEFKVHYSLPKRKGVLPEEPLLSK